MDRVLRSDLASFGRSFVGAATNVATQTIQDQLARAKAGFWGGVDDARWRYRILLQEKLPEFKPLLRLDIDPDKASVQTVLIALHQLSVDLVYGEASAEIIARLFSSLKQRLVVDLYRLNSSDLGFTGYASYRRHLERAHWLGFDLCPAICAPYLAANFPEEHFGLNFIASEPIEITSRPLKQQFSEAIFCLDKPQCSGQMKLCLNGTNFEMHFTREGWSLIFCKVVSN